MRRCWDGSSTPQTTPPASELLRTRIDAQLVSPPVHHLRSRQCSGQTEVRPTPTAFLKSCFLVDLDIANSLQVKTQRRRMQLWSPLLTWDEEIAACYWTQLPAGSTSLERDQEFQPIRSIELDCRTAARNTGTTPSGLLAAEPSLLFLSTTSDTSCQRSICGGALVERGHRSARSTIRICSVDTIR